MTSPRRRALLLLAAVVAGTVSAAPAAAESPIQAGNRASALPGRENGRLPASDLITVEAGCMVARAAAPSLRLMLADARSRGVGLGANDCYRPIEGQQVQQRAATARGNSACAATVATAPSGRPVGTSIHGWGKAVDFSNVGGSMTFTSPGYRYLRDNAHRFGWNHPAFARQGTACPEAWHWEWVGDGGTLGADHLRADAVSLLPSAGGSGYSVVTGLGAIAHRGDAADLGSAASLPLNWLVVGSSATPSGSGYWLVAADGGIFSFGDAGFHGSTGDIRLNRQIVGMASTPSGGGYWLVAADGGIFTFGDAGFHGSTGDIRLNQPIVGMAPTASGGGYWLVAADGGIFTFGDAAFHGSTGALRLNQPVTGMAPTFEGSGYWLVAADGGIFTFGTAPFLGSTGDHPPAQPVVSMTRTPGGDGYWFVAANGEVYGYGSAAYHGAG